MNCAKIQAKKYFFSTTRIPVGAVEKKNINEKKGVHSDSSHHTTFQI
jgi:hypothetical protein